MSRLKLKAVLKDGTSEFRANRSSKALGMPNVCTTKWRRMKQKQ